MNVCRYFLSNWLLALGRKKDDDGFVRRESQGLQKGAFLRVPAADHRHVRLKNLSSHPSKGLPSCISFIFYMRERGFLYPACVMSLFMPYHLLDWSFGNRQAFLRGVESLSPRHPKHSRKKTNKGHVSLSRVSCDCKERESLITRSTFCCQAVEAALLTNHSSHGLQSLVQ